MNVDPEFLDTPAQPRGLGEAGDWVSPEPRPVEFWANAKTGFVEPVVVVFDRHGKLHEREWLNAGKRQPAPMPASIHPTDDSRKMATVVALLAVVVGLWLLWNWLV